MKHPTFPELARAAAQPERDADLATHIESCALCQLTVASVLGEDSDAVLALNNESKASREIPELAVGQVWRLAWMEESAFGAIMDLDDLTVEVLPIVEDPELIRDPLSVWAPADSPVGFSAALWPGPSVRVPYFVLDRFYAEVAIPDRRGDGNAPIPNSEGADALVSHVTSVLGSLSAQSWVPETNDLGWDAALETSGVSYSQLAKGLGLSAAEVSALRRGTRLLTSDEQGLASELLGLAIEELPGVAAIAVELVQALDRPVIRAAIQARADELGVDEASGRFQIARELAGSHHRSAGDISARGFWERVVDGYLNR